MFNSLVDSLIAEGIAIQVAGGISAIALEGKSLEGREGAAYAQRIYPTLTAWMRDVFDAYDNAYLTKTQMLQVFRVVKEDRIERVERFRKSYILQQTTQVAEVVVDELALLKAQLKAKSFECNKLKQELTETKIELVAEREVTASLFTSLRQLRLNSLVTKVTNVVTQRVGF